ncbi:Uncharacterized protein dnm_082700 [Desulfonema magnum]|uniref:Uncharacterized protein n=1 Tax=Desulfonema magnum TaxID=45655 RepID=A0A975BUW8_9BACT|nr:Uncharacterized protein dnm_082700 [Desulfonema magnum]
MFKFFSADRVHWQFPTRDIIRGGPCVSATKARRHEVPRRFFVCLCVFVSLWHFYIVRYKIFVAKKRDPALFFQ